MQSIFPNIQIKIEFNENTDENIEVFFKFGTGPLLPIDAARHFGSSSVAAFCIYLFVSSSSFLFSTSRTHTFTQTIKEFYATLYLRLPPNGASKPSSVGIPGTY
jgi:hypothetical protein